jgi:glutaminyl-tRNA synthetase
LKLDNEVRLKGAYVVKATSVVKDEEGNITEILCTYDPLSRSGMEIDRRVKGTIHWVTREHGVKIDVLEYDKLFTTEIVEDVIADFNKDSLIINDKAIFEPTDMKVGIPVQMMRKGYYVLDKSGVINKTISLKEGWNG